jgi:hypothetical protein
VRFSFFSSLVSTLGAPASEEAVSIAGRRWNWSVSGPRSFELPASDRWLCDSHVRGAGRKWGGRFLETGAAGGVWSGPRLEFEGRFLTDYLPRCLNELIDTTVSTVQSNRNKKLQKLQCSMTIDKHKYPQERPTLKSIASFIYT